MKWYVLGIVPWLVAPAAGQTPRKGPTPAADSQKMAEPALPGVTLTTQLSNSGWSVNFYFADENIREIRYRLDDAAEFQSTGMSPVVNPRTGRPVPMTFFSLPPQAGRIDRHTVAVKWIDAQGRERGPHELSFSLAAEVVKGAKHVLETLIPNSWIAFQGDPKGTQLVYFTPVLGHRNALIEIRYSVNDTSLDQKLPFEPVTDLGSSPGVGEGPYFVSVPPDTRSVSVKLRYVDGSESPTRTFDVDAARPQ